MKKRAHLVPVRETSRKPYIETIVERIPISSIRESSSRDILKTFLAITMRTVLFYEKRRFGTVIYVNTVLYEPVK